MGNATPKGTNRACVAIRAQTCRKGMTASH